MGRRQRAKLGELLVRAGAIDGGQLERGLRAQRDLGRPLGMTLVRLGFLDEDTLVRALAAQLGFPVVKLRGKRINPEVLELVPLDVAEKYRCLPLLVNDEKGERVLYLAMEDPADAGAIAEVGEAIGRRVRGVLVAPTELDEALHRFYHWASFAGADALGVPADPAQQLAQDPDDGLGFGGDDEPELLLLDEAEAEPEPAPALPGAADAILRALTQLLVEKGVIGRDELVERLRALGRGEDA